jgi:hypothetical protein
MKPTMLRIACLLLGLGLITGNSLAEDQFQYGFEERLRFEYWDEVFDLNENGSKPSDQFIRTKTSVWGKWNANDKISVYLKLTGEPYIYAGAHKGDDFIKDEIIFDNAYIDIKKPFDLPVTFRLGRQDLMNVFGEGFILQDGTPMDGSRTFYFNALRATWDINPKNTLDVLYISDPRKEQYLPAINNRNLALNVSDEQALVLYGKSKINDNWAVEPYYVYKNEGAQATVPELDLHTLGGRAVYSNNPWKVTAELAKQFGEYDGGRYRQGLGGYIHVDRSFPDVPLKPEATVGFYYQSGDDPQTSKNEGWDPLFSRWPWLSELVCLTYTAESKTGYWTNLQNYRAGVKLNLTDATKLTLTYNYLRANEDAGITGSIFSNSGKERGHLPQAMLYHKFNKNLDGYILGEYFIPGDFYFDGADNATFIRTQLQYKF